MNSKIILIGEKFHISGFCQHCGNIFESDIRRGASDRTIMHAMRYCEEHRNSTTGSNKQLSPEQKLIALEDLIQDARVILQDEEGGRYHAIAMTSVRP